MKKKEKRKERKKERKKERTKERKKERMKGRKKERTRESKKKRKKKERKKERRKKEKPKLFCYINLSFFVAILEMNVFTLSLGISGLSNRNQNLLFKNSYLASQGAKISVVKVDSIIIF